MSTDQIITLAGLAWFIILTAAAYAAPTKEH